MTRSTTSLTSKLGLLEEVRSLYLPIPEEVRDTYEKAILSEDRYIQENIEWIEEFKGHLLLRVFTGRKFKKPRGEENYYLTETRRRIEGIPRTLFCNIASYSYIGGYQYDYSSKGWDPEEAWIASSPSEGKRCGGWQAYDRKQLNEKYARHCSYEDYLKNASEIRYNFFEFLCLYRKEPKIEYLIKNGYPEMLNALNLLNTKGRNFREIFKCDPCWKEYLRGKDRKYLLLCRRLKDRGTIEWVVRHYAWLNDHKFLNGEERDYKFLESLEDGSTHSHYLASEWIDYLGFAKEAGYPLNEAKVRYPKNIIKAHDEAYDKLQEIKDAQTIKDFREQASKYTDYAYSAGGLLIRPAKEVSELNEESRALHHCVRTYAKKVAEGETMIFFVRREEGVPYVTLELKGKKIIQVRADHNARPEEEVIEFIQGWKKHFRLQGWV